MVRSPLALSSAQGLALGPARSHSARVRWDHVIHGWRRTSSRFGVEYGSTCGSETGRGGIAITSAAEAVFNSVATITVASVGHVRSPRKVGETMKWFCGC